MMAAVGVVCFAAAWFVAGQWFTTPAAKPIGDETTSSAELEQKEVAKLPADEPAAPRDFEQIGTEEKQFRMNEQHFVGELNVANGARESAAARTTYLQRGDTWDQELQSLEREIKNMEADPAFRFR